MQCSGKPVPGNNRFASGTHGMIVPTGTSDKEVEGSKGSKNKIHLMSYFEINVVKYNVKNNNYSKENDCKYINYLIRINLPSFCRDIHETSSAIFILLYYY